MSVPPCSKWVVEPFPYKKLVSSGVRPRRCCFHVQIAEISVKIAHILRYFINTSGEVMQIENTRNI